MRNIVIKLAAGLAIATIGMCGADNSLGTWTRNLAKSVSTPPAANPMKSLIIINAESGGWVQVTATGERQDGSPLHGSCSIKYDGKEYPVTGEAWDRISMKQIDANTFTFERKKTGGNYHVTGRTVISKDGNTMTTTVKGTDGAGKPTSGKYVYDKQ